MRSGRTCSTFRRAVLVSVAVLTGACDHSTPFASRDTSLDGPLVGGTPARLTYGGSGGASAWLPDGSGLVFPFTDRSRDDSDQCLGLMPASGGTLARIICHEGAGTTDTLDRLRVPAVNDASGLAFVRASRRVGSVVDRERWLLVGSWNDPAAAARVRSIPFPSERGGQLSSLGGLEWLGSEQLAMVANAETLIQPCPTCDAFLVESGRDLLLADVSGATAVFTTVVLPGNVTSIAADAGVLYYTLGGDTRVFRQASGTGAATVAHDFAGHGVIREIDVAGGRLAAITDGLASQYDTPEGIVVQPGPGELWLVDLASGAEQPITIPDHLFRNPAVSPDGETVIAEGVPVQQTEGGGIIIVGGPDLWRIGNP